MGKTWLNGLSDQEIGISVDNAFEWYRLVEDLQLSLNGPTLRDFIVAWRPRRSISLI